MTWLERERGSPVQYRDWHVGVKQARRSLVILWPTRAELGTIILRRNVGPVGSWLMPPTTSRDFQKAAAQRLTTAETLLREKHTLDAQYLGGQTVECCLKALILELTPITDKAEKLKEITAGARMHRPEVLLGELRNLGVSLPLDLARRMRRFDWTTELRYETGRRDTGETAAFLTTAKAIHDWVERQLP